MKRTYNQPICTLVNVNAQSILMGSGEDPKAPQLQVDNNGGLGKIVYGE